MKVKHILGISIFSLVLGLGFMACSDDDDDPKTPEIPTAVVGIWKYETTNSEVEAKDDETKAAIEKFIEELPNSGVDTYNLKANKTYEAKIVGAEKDSTGAYVYDNGKISFDDKELGTLFFKDDTISSVKDVKAAVIEALELEEGDVTKADAIKYYERISK